eukprot:3639154-Amphidinium_carterae.1
MQPNCGHRDLEARALAALRAGVQIVWMKAHQADRDAEEGRVDRADLQGNHMADVAANNGTSEHVAFDPSEGWKRWGTWGRNCVIVLSNGVRLPAPEPAPVVVDTVETAVLPAAPFVVGPHQRVVEDATYAIGLDCSRHVGIHTPHWQEEYQLSCSQG